MNKAELVGVLAAKSGHSKVMAAAVLDALVGTVGEALSNGNEVAIAGLGSFKPQPRAAREGRNPVTGDKVKIPAKVVPKFTAAKALKDAAAAGGTKKGKGKAKR